MADQILIVEDDPLQRELLSMLLRRETGYQVIEADHGRAALDVLQKSPHVRLVIMDLDMPVMNGLEALEIMSGQAPDLPVIMLTGNTDVENAVQAMRRGAVDFLTKPYEPRRLTVTVHNALRLASLSREVIRLRRQENGALTFSDVIGADDGLRESVATGRKAAQANIPVLLQGETGVGKEVFARAIHGESARAGAPFVAINCGAIPENLVESTLFGHEKGAFTGASTKTLGKFREAEGGTIFLDEVSELPRETQVKLLRVLQQKEIEPVGAGKAVPVNVRVISASNRDLTQDVKAGRFREDLFFRLNVLQITLPPLRARKQDIPALAHYFLDRYCALNKTRPKTLSEAALQMLATKPWPGNVRELENTIYRAMVLSDRDVIDAIDLEGVGLQGAAIPDRGPGAALTNAHLFTPAQERLKTLDELEREAIRHAIAHYKQDMDKAAVALGVAKSTLYRKVRDGARKP